MALNDVFAPLIEVFGLAYLGPFSDDVYLSSLYTPIGLTLFISSFFVAILFYYVINHTRFRDLVHWLMMAILNSIICFSATYYIVTNEFIIRNIINQYSAEYYSLGVIVGVQSILFYFIFSMLIKWWSTNGSKTPF